MKINASRNLREGWYAGRTYAHYDHTGKRVRLHVRTKKTQH